MAVFERTATFPANYASLQPIADFIIQATEEAGLDREKAYAVQLAVDEACSNIIDHAYGGEGRGDLHCRVTAEGQAFVVTLYDHGRRFDLDRVPKPRLKLPLRRVERRGVGVFLMRRMMDELHHTYQTDVGNILKMVKYR
jgi:serine/threonine-protein kinase RsbW